jgi:hypothetical protein
MKPLNMKKYLYILSILCTLLCSTCSYDDIVPDNPCNGFKYTKAEIIIEEQVGDRWFEGDTVGDMNPCRFSSVQSAEEYTWCIGAEVLKTKSFIRKYFPSGWLDVSLVIKRKPNKLCFPNDDGIDSIYKRFYVWPDYQDINGGPPIAPYYPIYGTYKGYKASNPSRQIIVTLFDTAWLHGRYNDIPGYVQVLKGIPYEERSTIDSGYREMDMFKNYSPKAIRISFPSGLGKDMVDKQIAWLCGVEAYAYIIRQKPNNIVIEYNYGDTINYPYPLPNKDIFYGTKIY